MLYQTVSIDHVDYIVCFGVNYNYFNLQLCFNSFRDMTIDSNMQHIIRTGIKVSVI